MKCPVCSSDLQIATRAGIEIDYCPTCRGVWLDRGELDKIIERHVLEIQSLTRGAPVLDPSGSRAPAARPHAPSRSHYEDDEDDFHRPPHTRKRRKKRDWLEDLFDLFD